MANTFLRKTSRGIGNTAVTVGNYTVTSNLGAVVVGLSISNLTGDEVGADVIINNGNNDYYVLKDAPIPNGSTLIAAGKDQKIVLQSGDSVKVRSTDDTSIDVVMSIMETDSAGLTDDGDGTVTVTYTQGVDYTIGTARGGSFPYSYMELDGEFWSNTVGRDLIFAQPAGTVYTIISNASVYTFTTSATWASEIVAGTYSPSPITEYITSITFTPA